MLLALRKIAAAMRVEADGRNEGVGGSAAKELVSLRAENEELRKMNAKQEYRIRHLVHSLRGALEERDKKNDGKQ